MIFLNLAWMLFCVLSCYGIVWFFKHGRTWAEGPAKGPVSSDVAEAEVPPAPRGADVMVFFAVWLVVQLGFMGLLLDFTVHPRLSVSVAEGFDLLLPDATPPFLLIIANLLGQCVTLALMLPFASAVRGLPQALGLDRVPNLRHILLLAFLWLCFVVPCFTVEQLWRAFLEWVGHKPFQQFALQTYADSVAEGDALTIVAVSVSAVGLAPVLEELLYRGMLHSFLRQNAGLVVAMLVSGAFFSVMHMVPSVLLPLFVMGCLLSAIFEWRRSLWDCIFFHAFFNFCSLLVATLFVLWGLPRS